MDALLDKLRSLLIIGAPDDRDKVAPIEELQGSYGREVVVAVCRQILTVIKPVKEEREQLTEQILAIPGVVDLLLDSIDGEPLTVDQQLVIAETIAELAKSENARIPFSEARLIKFLTNLLDANEPSLLIQACRGIGNICYENDIGRKLFADEEGISRLINLMNRLYDEDVKGEPERGAEVRLHAVLTGCLLNTTNTYEYSLDMALKEDVIPVVVKYLKTYGKTNEDVAVHSLLLLQCLTEYEAGRDCLLSRPVFGDFLGLFDEGINDSTLEGLVEVFGSICEDEQVKETLADLEFPHKLIRLANRIECEPFVVKILSDLIALVLIGDGSMKKLYSNGEGFVYKECVKWLKSPDTNKIIAGALAMGNFARNDKNCFNMVADGVHEKLKSVIDANVTTDSDMRLQHACLSALRNLSIPNANKSVLVESGLIEVLLRMREVQAYPVVFKLLGTLRMLLERQESVANRITADGLFLVKLVEYCSIVEHPGIKGESTRLLASIVKNGHNSDVVKKMIEVKGTEPLVAMISSEHMVMQSEAFVALSILFTCLHKNEAQTVCDDRQLPQILGKYFKEVEKPAVNEAFKESVAGNALALVEVLVKKCPNVGSALVAEEVPQYLAKINIQKDDAVREKLHNVMKLLNGN